MPRWPQANGIAERLMKSIKKVYQTAHTERRSGQQALHEFLRNYRATPHQSTGVSPSSLTFQRKVKTCLPNTQTRKVSKSDATVRQRDAQQKQRMKTYADNNRNIKAKHDQSW